MDSPAIRVLSLFSGVGGLDLGVRMALPSRVVCYVEGEAYACAVLAHQMEEARLDAAPIWSDVTTFDGKPWRGRVDLIAGGFPCQDLSVAGKRAGIREGKRSGLWSEFARIIGEVEPRFVFVENVRGLAGDGLGVVLSDLADLGFDAEWLCLRASEVGAPHRRERIFVLAYRDGGRLSIEREPVPSGERSAPWHEPDRCGGEGSEVGNPPGIGRGEGRAEHGIRSGGRSPAEPGGEVADASHDLRGGGERGEEEGTREGRERGRGSSSEGERVADSRDRLIPQPGRGPEGREGAGSAGESLPLFPPGPGDAEGWAWVLERWPELAPAVDADCDRERGLADAERAGAHEQLRRGRGTERAAASDSPRNGAIPEAPAQPPLCRVAHGMAHRVDRLRACGNGVVPAQAGAALRELWRRMNLANDRGIL